MIHLELFKDQVTNDWAKFCEKFNFFTGGPRWWKITIYIILILFFPYILLLWWALLIYKYLFIYLFLLLDILLLDICFTNLSVAAFIYNSFKRCVFIIFYNPLFIYLSACYKWIGVNVTIFNFKKYIWGYFKKGIYWIFSPITWLSARISNWLWIKFKEIDLLFSPEAWSNRYNRYLIKRQERSISRMIEKRKKHHESVINRLRRETQFRIFVCDLQIWWINNVHVVYSWWYYFLYRTHFIYVFFMYRYLLCKYMWHFRYAYFDIFKRWRAFYFGCAYNIIKINYFYYYHWLLNILYFKPQLFFICIKFFYYAYKRLCLQLVAALIRIFLNIAINITIFVGNVYKYLKILINDWF